MNASVKRIHDITLSFVMFITLMLLIVPPYGLLAGFCDESLYLIFALWGEIIYLVLTFLIRAVMAERKELRNLESKLLVSGQF